MASHPQLMRSLSVTNNYVLVAAIDFGTTFSGYAFSFKNETRKIFMNKNWGENYQAYKTPTSVLLDSKQQFTAFGYEAEDRYAAEIESSDEPREYHLYKHFKMLLHDNVDLHKDTMIYSLAGKPAPALTIFAMALQYLKDHLIKAVSNRNKGTLQSLFRWVITVPAIWSEEAKQFMREAAFQAGIISDKQSKQLLIALEPEAASMFCRGLKVDHFSRKPKKNAKLKFDKGCKYLVIDAGGGTIDLTAHQVVDSGKVKEIAIANGGPWGGTIVNENFIQLLKDVISADFIDDFSKEYPQHWLVFMNRFDLAKRSANPDRKSKIKVPFPSMMDFFACDQKIDIKVVINQRKRTGVSFNNGSIVLEHEVVMKLYESVINDIVSNIWGLKDTEEELDGCSFFMLVGGFSESLVLQKAISDVFEPSVTILVPEEAQLSVIKGAVMFGHDPHDIQIRKARKTYGYQVTPVFDATKHDQLHSFQSDDGVRHSKLFQTLVQKGSDVNLDGTEITVYNQEDLSDTIMLLQLYESVNSDPMYVDEEGCRHIGDFPIVIPSNSEGERVNVEITPGFTEIQVHGAHDDNI